MLNPGIIENIRNCFLIKNSEGLNTQSILLIEELVKTSYMNGNTYYHPLGFIYCKLFDFSETESLRIHIWDNERKYQNPQLIIHDHYYNINSYILKGQITNNIFSIGNSGENNHCEYVVTYKENLDRVLSKTATERYLELKYSEVISEGSHYSIIKGEYHSSDVEENLLTCTIVYTSDAIQPQPIVFGPTDGEQEYLYKKELVPAEKITRLLETIIKFNIDN